MTPGRDDRDALVAELWAERHNGIAWAAGSRPKPKTPRPAHQDDGTYPDIPRDDDITTARRRRELLAAVADHEINEREAK